MSEEFDQHILQLISRACMTARDLDADSIQDPQLRVLVSTVQSIDDAMQDSFERHRAGAYGELTQAVN